MSDSKKPHKYTYQVITTLELEFDPEKNRSMMKSCDLFLNCDEQNEKFWKDENGIPNAEGTQAQSLALVQGLSASIHGAHQLGIRDSAEHLRFVISELERSFAHNMKTVQFVDQNKS